MNKDTNIENRIEGLLPIVFPDSEILILGTFPSVITLEYGVYYANRGNRFWSLITELYGEEKPEVLGKKDYINESRQFTNGFLKRHHLALWDIYKSVVREGSSDKNIKYPEVNDLNEFLKDHPSIKKILIAGRRAQKAFAKINSDYKCFSTATIYNVPSTSCANTHFDKSKWKEALNLKDLIVSH